MSDSELHEKLKQDLPINLKRKIDQVEPDDEDDSENTEDETLKQPVCQETKQKIYTVLKDLCQEDINSNEKLLSMINKINTFTEEQARAYFEMLNFDYIASWLVHKNDTETVDFILKDDHVVSSLSTYLGLLFSKLGNISGILIFFTYIFYSHHVYGKTALAETSIQNDGERPESNGQNHANGQINENRMGK